MNSAENNVLDNTCLVLVSDVCKVVMKHSMEVQLHLQCTLWSEWLVLNESYFDRKQREHRFVSST